MDVKFAGGAAVNPCLGGDPLANIARKRVPRIWRGESEYERVVVGLVVELHWQVCTSSMKINAARPAMIRKSATLVSAGVAAEEAFRVNGLRVEGESVLPIEGVVDLLGQL